jgi:hypothetical protein
MSEEPMSAATNAVFDDKEEEKTAVSVPQQTPAIMEQQFKGIFCTKSKT